MSACRPKERRHLQISVDFGGKTYQANYSVSSGVVTVNSWYGSASTKADGMKGEQVEQVARTLFRELLQAALLQAAKVRGTALLSFILPFS